MRGDHLKKRMFLTKLKPIYSIWPMTFLSLDDMALNCGDHEQVESGSVVIQQYKFKTLPRQGMTGGDKTKQKLDHQGQVDVYLRIVVKKFGNETFLMLLLKLYIFKSGSFTVSFSLFSSFLYSSIKKCSLSMKFSDGWFKILFLWCQLRPPANCATIKAVCITDKNE